MRFPKLKKIAGFTDLLALGALAVVSVAVLSETSGTEGLKKFVLAEKARQKTAIKLAETDLAQKRGELAALRRVGADLIALEGRQRGTHDRLVREKIEVDLAAARSRLEISKMATLIERSSQENGQTRKNVDRIYAGQFYEALQNALMDETMNFAETAEKDAGRISHIGHAVLQNIEHRMELSADQNATVRDQEFLVKMNGRCPKLWDFDLYIDPLPLPPKPGVEEKPVEMVSPDALARWNDTQRARMHKLAEFGIQAQECACRTLFDKCERI